MILKKIKELKENRYTRKCFPILEVEKKVIGYYRNNVKDNLSIDDSMIKRKISRDFYCGEKAYENKVIIVVRYGFLKITYNKNNNKIIFLKNSSYDICRNLKKKNGHINNKLKRELNKVYKIQ